MKNRQTHVHICQQGAVSLFAHLNALRMRPRENTLSVAAPNLSNLYSPISSMELNLLKIPINTNSYRFLFV